MILLRSLAIYLKEINQEKPQEKTLGFLGKHQNQKILEQEVVVLPVFLQVMVKEKILLLVEDLETVVLEGLVA